MSPVSCWKGVARHKLQAEVLCFPRVALPRGAAARCRVSQGCPHDDLLHWVCLCARTCGRSNVHSEFLCTHGFAPGFVKIYREMMPSEGQKRTQTPVWRASPRGETEQLHAAWKKALRRRVSQGGFRGTQEEVNTLCQVQWCQQQHK